MFVKIGRVGDPSRGRWAFWGLFAAVMALVSIPSTDLIEAVKDYASVAQAWSPTPLRPSRTTFTPREPHADDAAESELTPLEFRLKAPNAADVELVGDFNAWTPGLLKMKRGAKGMWSIIVPVHPGRLKYLFLADGDPFVDPDAETTDGPDGRRVSVRQVQ